MGTQTSTRRSLESYSPQNPLNFGGLLSFRCWVTRRNQLWALCERNAWIVVIINGRTFGFAPVPGVPYGLTVLQPTPSGKGEEVTMPNPMKARFSRRKRKRGQIETVEEQYKKLRHTMLESDAWRNLSGPGVKVYLKLCRRFNGRNNGQIHLSLAEAAKLLHIGKSTAKRALLELEEHGFIKFASRGSFFGRLAATFILTDNSYQGHHPTNEWRSWRPPRLKTDQLTKSVMGFQEVRIAAYLERDLLNN